MDNYILSDDIDSDEAAQHSVKEAFIDGVLDAEDSYIDPVFGDNY